MPFFLFLYPSSHRIKKTRELHLERPIDNLQLSLTNLLSPLTPRHARSSVRLEIWFSEAIGIMMRRALAPDNISNQKTYTSSCMTLPFNLVACSSLFPSFFPFPIPFGWWDNPVPGWDSQRFRALVYLTLHTGLFDLFCLMPFSYDRSQPCFVGLPRILFPISTRGSIYIALMAV